MSDDGIEAKIAGYARVHGSPGYAVIELTDVEAMMRELFAAGMNGSGLPILDDAQLEHYWGEMDEEGAGTLERMARRAIELGASPLTPEEKALRADIIARGGR